MNLKLIDKYKALGIDDIIDHDKFNHYAIVQHSTVLEGSTLTSIETQVLLDDGLTPTGKPLQDSLMVTDHYTALKYTLGKAREHQPVTVSLIQMINSLAIKNTGGVFNTVFGTVDATKGEFRKGNVTGGESYFPNFDKVEKLIHNMVDKIAEMMSTELTLSEQLNLSFDAHYNLVSIHPFYDGNGRASRLLMNYIQAYYDLPLAIVHNEAKAEYIQALIDTRKKDDISIFRKFMSTQYELLLKSEIQKYEEIQKPSKGLGFTLLF